MFQIHTECIYNCKACLFVSKSWLISKSTKKSRNRDSFFLSTLHSPNTEYMYLINITQYFNVYLNCNNDTLK